MRGLGGMAIGQRLLEGVEAAQGIRRIHTTATVTGGQSHTCVRAVVQSFETIANSLRHQAV